ncbi:MAG: hypothetical protein AAGB51_08840 [Planctomycetota bacterium]
MRRSLAIASSVAASVLLTLLIVKYGSLLGGYGAISSRESGPRIERGQVILDSETSRQLDGLFAISRQYEPDTTPRALREGWVPLGNGVGERLEQTSGPMPLPFIRAALGTPTREALASNYPGLSVLPVDRRQSTPMIDGVVPAERFRGSMLLPFMSAFVSSEANVPGRRLVLALSGAIGRGVRLAAQEGTLDSGWILGAGSDASRPLVRSLRMSNSSPFLMPSVTIRRMRVEALVEAGFAAAPELAPDGEGAEASLPVCAVRLPTVLVDGRDAMLHMVLVPLADDWALATIEVEQQVLQSLGHGPATSLARLSLGEVEPSRLMTSKGWVDR